MVDLKNRLDATAGSGFNVHGTGYGVYDIHFRLDCILASLIWFYPLLRDLRVDFTGINMHEFERQIMFVLRYALSEMCSYYRGACKYCILLFVMFLTLSFRRRLCWLLSGPSAICPFSYSLLSKSERACALLWLL